SAPEAVIDEFERQYRARYGFLTPGRALVIESIAVEARALPEQGGPDTDRCAGQGVARRRGSRRLRCVARRPVYFAGAWIDTPFYDRTQLGVDDQVVGPAVILEANTTTVVEPGWRAEVLRHGELLLRRIEPMQREAAIGTHSDPILLEVFNNLFMSIAEQMGVALASTASSVNIKERLDFSCAVFDAQGQLIANAPHMPVHLGSMGES